MARLEELTRGAVVSGIFGDRRVRIVDVAWHGSTAITLTYTDEVTGRPGQELLYRDDEPRLSVEQAGRAWSMDGDGHHFRLASEAKRISLAYLFDPFLAVQTSNLDPLPHQIDAVYNRMLPLQPLRFLLADDPGAGKTIMAGLLCKELMIRGDVERCLVIAPGSLVEQWQDELWQKFALDFRILTRDMIEASSAGNPFAEQNLLIARLDHLSRNEELQARLRATDWDLVVVDEAHKMSAHYTGGEIRETKRYRLGQLAGAVSRHLLLMTATPQAGIDADYRLFLRLLDADRFEGRGRTSGHTPDVSDVMRRLVKERLLTFDGRPLFPERRAYTGRRRERLERRVGEYRIVRRGLHAERVLEPDRLPAAWRDLADDFDVDDLPDGDLGDLETELVDEASAARTVAELEREIAVLADLERLAAQVRCQGQDRKWEELSALLTGTPEMFDASGARRKLIIFSEHRDTLERRAVTPVIAVGWVRGSVEDVAVSHGVTLARGHLDEVRRRTLDRVGRVADAVNARLIPEIQAWDHRVSDLRERELAGRLPASGMNSANARQRADDLKARLSSRQAELDAQRQLSSSPPVVAGAALVVPAGLLGRLLASRAGSMAPEATSQRAAIAVVLDTERSRGRAPREKQPAEQGFDVESRAPDGSALFIVVRGREADNGPFHISRTELGVARNTGGRHVLALVDGDRVRYIRDALTVIPGPPFGTSAISLPWRDYFERGQVPQ